MGTWGRGHKTGACSSAASSLDIASPAEDKLGGGSMPGEDVAPLQQVSILETAFLFRSDQEFESGFLQGGVCCEPDFIDQPSPMSQHWCHELLIQLGIPTARGVARTPLGSVGQAGEIIEHLRDQFLASRIPRLGRLSEEQDQISRLCCSLGPSRRRSSEGVALEFLLAASQGCLIGLNFIEAPANFRRFLADQGFPA